MSLKLAASSGVKWSTISQVGRQAMQFATTAILARLLSPSDFGLLGIATIVIVFINIFKDLGTSACIIQQKNLSNVLLSSIFWVNIAFGFAGTIILFALSPFVAIFYKEPNIIPILRVLSITLFISGFSIVQKSTLERKLKFNTLAKVEITSIIISSFVGISLAIFGFGVWSLVFQTLTIITTTTIQLWFICSWRPKLVFNWREVRKISAYSLNLTGFNVFNYFARNADYILIGKYLGTQDLGYYTLAYQLMLYPIQNISSIVGRVMFPAFSLVQDNNVKFCNAYLKVVGSIALITFPIVIGLWATAEPFILSIFGSDWMPVISLVMILAPIGTFQSIGTTVSIIYQAKGRTDWMLWWGIGSGITVILAIAFGLRWGIVGVASAYAIAYISILMYPCFAIPFRLIDLPISEFFRVLWRSLAASLIMLAMLQAVKLLLPASLAYGWVLGILVTVGIIVYSLASLLINKEQILEFLGLLGVKL